MRVARVRFLGLGVPIAGTSVTQWDFSDGWVIDVEGRDVTLERPAVPEQNVDHIPAFTVRGLAFWFREAVPVPVPVHDAAPKRRRRDAA